MALDNIPVIYSEGYVKINIRATKKGTSMYSFLCHSEGKLWAAKPVHICDVYSFAREKLYHRLHTTRQVKGMPFVDEYQRRLWRIDRWVNYKIEAKKLELTFKRLKNAA